MSTASTVSNAPKPVARDAAVPAFRVGGFQAAAYEVLAFAGSGTFAEVWQVRERRSGKPFAVKQLRPEWEGQRVARKLLENEAEVGQRVSSPHVLRVFDAQLASTPRFVVMEWLSGCSLERRLTDGARLPVNEALWIARQCAQGLGDLLHAGFTHGDVKPANVFLGRDGSVKLIDLGFARPVSSGTGDLALDDRGCLTGTPEYMAPETVAGGTCSGTGKDVYGLGVTLYRLLTGRLPFHGETVADIVRSQQRALPPRLRALAPHVPREVAELVERLLAKQPFRRCSGLHGLIQELISLEIGTLAEAVRCAVKT